MQWKIRQILNSEKTVELLKGYLLIKLSYDTVIFFMLAFAAAGAGFWGIVNYIFSLWQKIK